MLRLDKLTDDQILKLRFSDLPITIEKSLASRAIKQLYQEIKEKGLRFRPHVWFSSEWFAPDGIPGIAIPFYLGHPRLLKLEKKIMLEAEGESYKECMKILRHEAGHAVDNAFRLYRKKKFREIFGSYSQKYPDEYRPKPNSRRFVLHLDSWYAQAHPAEDFAETFAVWLTPGYRWRQRYKDWPALDKLVYVDQLMVEIKDKKPIVSSKKTSDSIDKLKQSLESHYQARKLQYSSDRSGSYDRDLRRIFSADPAHYRRKSAAKFIRESRAELRQLVSDSTGTPPYCIDQLLQDIIQRAKELKLVMAESDRETREKLLLMLVVQTMNVIHHGRYTFAL